MSQSRVIIDLNAVDEDGETAVFLRDVTGGELKVGWMTTAYEPDDGVCAPARVASIREDLGVAFLQVDWKALRREDTSRPRFRLNKRGWVTSTAAHTTAQLQTTARVQSAQAAGEIVRRATNGVAH